MTTRIVEFLRRIGIEVQPASLSAEECFLPGIRLDCGRLAYDAAALTYPGDLLHEGGHIAVAPPEVRDLLSGAASGGEPARGGRHDRHRPAGRRARRPALPAHDLLAPAK